MEYDRKHWKAAKALIVVIPLLGKSDLEEISWMKISEEPGCIIILEQSPLNERTLTQDLDIDI